MNNGVIVKDKHMDHDFLKMLFFFFPPISESNTEGERSQLIQLCFNLPLAIFSMWDWGGDASLYLHPDLSVPN